MPTPAAAIEERSKLLFGNVHMLTLCGWIGGLDGVFSTTEVCTGAQVPASSVHRALQVLTSCDLVTKLPRGTAERTQWYQRREHLFWAAVQDLRASLEVMTGAAP